VLGGIILLMLLATLLVICWGPVSLRRRPFSAPEASYSSWEEILSHPRPIALDTYATGTMRTSLSGIVNLKHELAEGIADEPVEIPVIVGLIEHQERGSYLIDAGLDASYTHRPYGSMRGLLVESFLGRGALEPGTQIAAVLDREGVDLQGVFLTHLHFDHTAGIVDLPQDIPYVASKDEPYRNFRFIMHGDHLAGIDQLYDIDLAQGVDLPPLGRGVDIFGDGSFWAISSSGHTRGHLMYFVNGVEDQVLLTGDACNNQYQFDTGVGPGSFSSDLEGGQEVLERIILFKEHYPDVTLVYGHDHRTH
jgi:glyoxylase-like metal-dependent hydrolase (beta-lactamase superfamily II)